MVFRRLVSYWLAGFAVIALVIPGLVVAGITFTGVIDPPYDGSSDPWLVADGNEFIIGFEADGMLSITGGSDVTSNYPTYIGDYALEGAGTTGTLVLTGSGSTLSIDPAGGSQFFVGPFATGYVTVGDLAILTTHDTVIGGSPVESESEEEVTEVVAGEGHATVSGGGQWSTGDGWLMVGAAGSGELTIQDAGSSVTTDTSEVGLLPDAVGDVLVDQSGSWTLTGDLVVGVWGEGSLTVSGGGQVQSARSWVGGVSRDVMDYNEPVFEGLGEPNGTGAVVVAGAGSQWDAGSTLTVGSWGTGDLRIEDGGQVTATQAFIGGMPLDLEEGQEFSWDLVADGTGTVTVTGTNSTLEVTSPDTLFVGYSSTGVLDVNEGGQVISSGIVVGGAPHATGTITVHDAGSLLQSDEELLIGAWGDGHVTIFDGGAAEVGNLTIGGFDANDTGLDPAVEAAFGDPNGTGTLVVTGGGSSLDVFGEAYIGNYGTGIVDVNTGGTVDTSQTVLGAAPGSYGEITVDGVGSSWQVSIDPNFDDDTGLYSGVMVVGGYGEGLLTVSGGGDVTVDDVIFLGGYPTAELSFDANAVGYEPNGIGTITVTDSGSTLTTDGIGVGDTGQGTLEVLNGGQVLDEMAMVGVFPGSVGEVLVNGAGSLWQSTAGVFVGGYGEGTVTVSGGGAMEVGEALYIGGYDPNEFDTPYGLGDPSGTGTVTVTGTGSVVDAFAVGVGVTGNGTLEILHGGRVESQIGMVGVDANAVGTVTVDGQDSTWRLSGDTAFSTAFPPPWELQGDGELVVSNGGAVEVDGAEATLAVSEGITIGSEGEGTLTVDHGGGVFSDSVVLGGTDPDFDTLEEYFDPDAGLGTGTGTATIGGAGSLLQTEDLHIGFSGTGNLTIEDGGQVIDEGAWIGVTPDAVGTALITGVESTWSNTANLVVGAWGEGNLTIAGGAGVTAPEVFIGGTSFELLGVEYDPNLMPDGTGIVTVTGDGSTLDVTGFSTLYVGYGGTGVLDVNAGGDVTAESVVIGGAPDVTGTVTVEGAGSMLATDGMTVGAWGTGHLTIADGADVTAEHVTIGGFDVSDVNDLPQAMLDDFGEGLGTGTVTVTGAGSTLTVTGDDTLIVGAYGTGTLTVSDGADVNSGQSFVGGYVTFEGEEETEVATLHEDGTGTATVTGSGSTWVNEILTVGTGGEGTLTVSAGGAVANNLGVLGLGPDSTGTVTITGPGSTWSAVDANDDEDDFDGTLIVGAWGEGTLTVADGGQVDAVNVYIGGADLNELGTEMEWGLGNPDGTGTVTVTGSNSTLAVASSGTLYVGHTGEGTLNILAGASVDSDAATIGYAEGSLGVVNVTGSGSTWMAGPGEGLVVGRSGTGRLAISEGGAVTDTSSVILGEMVDSSGEVLVTGSDSELDVTNTMWVGYRGEGTLTIADGASVVTQAGHLGEEATATGSVLVTGDASEWIVGDDLYVGYAGSGTVEVNDGGRLSVDESLYVGGHEGGSGGTGTVIIRDGGELLIGEELYVWQTGTLGGDGTISIYTPTTLHNHGTIAPGDDDIGTLTVEGNVVFHTDSTYAVQIANDSSDLFMVDGDVTIEGGTVQVDSVGTILGEHQYEIIQASAVTGEFDDLDTALLDFSFTEIGLDYNDVSVWLYVTAANFDDPNIARTYNQRQVAAALQGIANEGGNDITDELQQLATADDVRNAYDQLSGQTRSPVAPLTVANTSKFLGTVTSRVQTLQTGLVNAFGGQSLYAMAGPDTSVGDGRMVDVSPQGQTFAVGRDSATLGDRKWGLWGRGYGLYGDRESESGMPGYSYDTYGGSIGADYRFSDAFLAGIVGGLSEGDVDFAASRDSTDFDAMHIGLYGSRAWTEWYLDYVLTYADLEYDTERFVDLTSERLEGTFDGYELAGYVEMGLNWDLVPDLKLQPLASLQYTYLDLDSYTETGGASALAFDGETFESVKGGLGARLTHRLIESPSDFRADVQFRGRWIHEFGDTRSSVDSSFVSDPTVVFNIRDEEISRDSAILGVGLAATINSRTRAYLDFDTRLNSDESVHVISAALQYRW